MHVMLSSLQQHTLELLLPKWIVEKQNSVWVLAVYGLVFMVILPVVVVSVLRKRFILMVL